MRRSDCISCLEQAGCGVHEMLLYERLEQGRFRIPRVAPGSSTATLDATDLTMLLDGIDLDHVRRPKLWDPPRAAASG